MKKVFAANWKLQKNPHQAIEFCEKLKNEISKNQNFYDKHEVMIFPQNYSLFSVLQSLKDSSIACGPQNIHTELAGAFTGENSAQFAQEIGAQIILLGHSERRQYFHESSKALNKKLLSTQKLNLIPVFCIGETLEERQSGKTEMVCFEQLVSAFNDVDRSKRIVVAYEPVWAIGTGQVASTEQVADIHKKLNLKMKDLGFTDFQLLYGGSVKPDNAKELLALPNVDGFLIGGASLEVESFMKICLS